MRDAVTQVARGSLALTLVVALAGCDCGGPPATDAPLATTSVAPPEPELAGGENDLPTAPSGEPRTPAITIEASARGYRTTNRALVESWPVAERERVHAAAPPDRPDFPVVESDAPVLDDAPLLVPAVREALGVALEAERARSGGSGAPLAFAVRAPASLPWSRVARAIFTAAMAGLSEPRIVVRVGEDERELRLVSPASTAATGAPLDLTAALRALGTEGPGAGLPTGTATGPVEPASPPEPSGPMIPPAIPRAFALEDHGLRVRRGLVELGPGCTAPATDGSPAIPLVSLRDGHTVADCLTALGEGPATFSATADVTHGTAVVVLSELARRGPVEIVLGP